MKLVILYLASLCCVFPGALSYLFGGGSSVRCRYSEWSKCKLVDGEFLKQRDPLANQPKTCIKQSERCSRGTYVATSLMENFLTPIASHSYGSAGPVINECRGSQCVNLPDPGINQVYYRGNFTTSAGSNAVKSVVLLPKPTPYVPPPRPPCTEKKDRDGNLISGNCNTNKQGAAAGRRKRQTSGQKKRDLLIMLDESGSVGKPAFQNLKFIAAGIVKDLCLQARVDKYRTRVAVMSFDAKIHYHKKFNKYMKQKDLVDFIKKINYDSSSSGRTCMKKALDFARHTIFSNSHGARLNNLNVEQDIILITDGCANCIGGNSAAILNQASNQLIAKGISTYVLGIALGSGCQQKIKILGQGGNCEHFFYITKQDVSDVVAYLSAPRPCLSQFIFPGKC